jgi:hypothetical protein
MNVVGYDCENDTDNAMAEGIVRDIVEAYPGHGWFVTIKGGVIHVKDLDLNEKWGMCLHYSQIKGDAADRKKQVTRAAGEFLERANLKRGGKTEQTVTSIEGVPLKDMRPGI